MDDGAGDPGHQLRVRPLGARGRQDPGQGLPPPARLQAPRLLHRRRLHHGQAPTVFVKKIKAVSECCREVGVRFPLRLGRLQILKILKHGSVRGLSVASFELEIIGYTIGLAYCIHKGLPFSAYGELAFLLIQAIILVAIIYYYSPPMGIKTWMKALLYCGTAPTVLAGKIDPALFEVLYASQHAIFFFARVPQIWKNLTNKGTGELSFLTCFMNFAGSIVRVFTSIQEKTPLSVIMGSAIGIVMNGTLLGQILMYQKPAPKKEKKED